MAQLGFDLGAAPLPEQAPFFAGAAAFAQALSDWTHQANRQAQRTAQVQGQARLFANPIETPLGTMVAVCDAQALHLLEFADRSNLPKEMAQLARSGGRIAPGQTPVTRRLAEQLEAYFSEQLQDFDIPLALHGTEFTQAVWRGLLEVPFGATLSYGALAEQLSRPSATRAVARANGANQIAILIPCHRIIGADGTLTGYAGGLWRKRALLELEARGQPDLG